MSSFDFLFTSESVSEGHPDKVCDQISDAIVDKYLSEDQEARVALETMALTDTVILGGEVRGPEKLKKILPDIAREVIKDIGYEQEGFNWKSVNIINKVHDQSPDIAMGVDAGENKEEGAGDQGIMFGFAVNETPALLPATLYYAHKVLYELNQVRKEKYWDILGPDAKSQVTLHYKNGIPDRAESVVLSTQHHPDISQGRIREIVIGIIEKFLPAGWMPRPENCYVNPTGRFVIGGPVSDVGLTGRKIIVDTYGGAAPHGGGAFSGKDPTKVDRSAAYMCRYIAKNIVAAGLADACTIQLSYAIGVSSPLSFYINMKNNVVESDKVKEAILDLLNLTPYGIRNYLKLNRPIYRPTSTYGHFGRSAGPEGGFTWEKLDLVDQLKLLK